MSENHRYSFLDSTRGLAAFVVLLAHSIKTFAPNHFNSSFQILWDSESAVLYFFILSGFVLTESLKNFKLTIPSYCNFALKRFFRIYPAFILALISAFFLYPYFNAPTSSWLQSYWQQPISIKSFLSQGILIFRIPNDPNLRLLPHDWTLSIEIMISILIPFLQLIVRKNSFALLLLTYLSVKTLPIDTFIFDFSLGIFIAHEKEYLISLWKKLKTVGQVFFALVALFFLQMHLIFPESSKMLDQILIHSKSWGLAIVLIALFSTPIIQKLLNHNFFLFLGKISYSFYLFHLPILAIIYKLNPSLQFLPALFIISICTLLTSFLSYKFIEMPMIHISKKWFPIAKGK